MYTYVCICMYALVDLLLGTGAYMCGHISIFTHTYTYIYIYTYAYTHTYAYAYTYVYVCNVCTS